VTTSIINPTDHREITARRFRVTRRTALRVGFGIGLVAIGGLVYRSIDQGVVSATSGDAFELWRSWQPDGSAEPEALVGAAILAANPHNVQPWLFGVERNAIDVFGDATRQSAAMDPLGREFYIGLGCAVENLAVAARAAGLSGGVRLIANPGNELHAARIALVRAAARSSPLYAAIASRRVNRGPYRADCPVDEESRAALERLAADENVGIKWFTSADERQQFGAVTLEATQAFAADREQSEAAFGYAIPTRVVFPSCENHPQGWSAMYPLRVWWDCPRLPA
jgi:hypothetical protein